MITIKNLVESGLLENLEQKFRVSYQISFETKGALFDKDSINDIDAAAKEYQALITAEIKFIRIVPTAYGLEDELQGIAIIFILDTKHYSKRVRRSIKVKDLLPIIFTDAMYNSLCVTGNNKRAFEIFDHKRAFASIPMSKDSDDPDTSIFDNIKDLRIKTLDLGERGNIVFIANTSKTKAMDIRKRLEADRGSFMI